mgnify:CR=1 FL=1
MKTFANYCTPSRIYLGISIIAVIVVLLQNFTNPDQNQLCIGVYKCTMPYKALVLFFNIVYMLFWTWLLNFLCRKGLRSLAWGILIIPFLVIAIIIGSTILIINNAELNKKFEQHNKQ